MHLGLQSMLNDYRLQRGFCKERYLQARLRSLNDYFRQSGLSAAVVGVSGGIDSALVLALLVKASQCPGSPIQRVLPALMPMFVEAGASNQDIALARGREVASALGLESCLVDLSRPLAAMKLSVDQGFGREGEPWAAGQLVSYLRTPALYYLTALLTEQGHLAALCGTTNRDEGAYIGFFGKASDGMVDLQPIADLHKSEVIQLAEYLGLPQSVLQATPTGDTYDARPDEAMIGAPYDFLELYQHWLCAGRPPLLLENQELEQWNHWAANLESLHRKNLHKYASGSAAIFLDLMERPVPGGWRSESYPPLPDPTDPGDCLVGRFSLQTPPGSSPCVRLQAAGDFGDSLLEVESLLSEEECQQLLAELSRQHQVAVGTHGRPDDADPGRGSTRATAWSPLWAETLWQRLAPHFPRLRCFDELTPSDHGDHPLWRAVGVNPVLRFISYPPGGQLVPHYDAGFDFGDGRRHTLMSMVVYLNSLPSGQGGQTRFLLDRQRGIPVQERDHQDWQHPAGDHPVLRSVNSQAGKAIVFDHRLLHDGSPWHGCETRVLLRTDIVFERCALLPEPTLPDQPARTGECSHKLKADPFYGPLTSLLDLEALEEAGYFEDSRPGPSLDGRFDSAWLTTPLDKALTRLQSTPDSAPLAVLLATGAFCPVHPGHLEIMEQARVFLESQGTQVLGGYLSPSHDEYVQAKCGPQSLPASHRIRLCQQAVEASPWLMVDEWEALHTGAALNFSLVIERLTHYLQRHLPCARPIRVYYVFGSDNARFALSFLQRGQALCVLRPGFEEAFQSYADDPRLRSHPRVAFLRGTRPLALASSQIRQGELDCLQPAMRKLWLEWQSTSPDPSPLHLYLRNEGLWAIQPWIEPDSEQVLRARWEAFASGLQETLSWAFGSCLPPDPPVPLQVSTLSLSQQRAEVAHLLEGKSVISLDPCIPGKYNLRVSRCFELCSHRLRAGLVAPPGSPPLDHQLEQIPPGEYWLMDDDCATGHTLQEIARLLPSHCRVLGTQVLCHLLQRDASGRVDLGDLRDFLPGSREGGLVVALPGGTLARVPYLLPYVNPADRLGIPLTRSLEFSRRVWKLAREFFADLPLTLAAASPGCQALTEALGHPSTMTLEEWCQWHLERLGEEPSW